ncbi:MAG: hypothetical protein LH628_25900 [Microcoleus sp. CAN_BIN18]|nr:hypothetical protein [Microcoleus sp. CAN_BIN18]
MVSLPWFANLKTSLLKYFTNSIDISWQQGYIHFSVLLSKDRQTGAVGNGRLLPHFFWERHPKQEARSKKQEARGKMTEARDQGERSTVIL